MKANISFKLSVASTPAVPRHGWSSGTRSDSFGPSGRSGVMIRGSHVLAPSDPTGTPGSYRVHP